MVKLYNHTRVDDKILNAVLVSAARSVGAHSTGTVVKVTTNRTYYWKVNGTAYDFCYVRKWFIEKRQRNKQGDFKAGEIKCNGVIWLRIPYTTRNPHDKLELAESIYSVAAHEFRHIQQYERNTFNHSDRKERRRNHDNRVWERDAIKAASKATKKTTAQDVILKLALHLDELAQE